MQTATIKDIRTTEGESEFQIRCLKDEGVALLTTRTELNFLILDSHEYWYDLIQQKYPNKRKCSCSNEWFTVQFEYITQSHSTDFEQINVNAACTACQKASKVLSVDIDYSPTDKLFSNPITFCELPNIQYAFSEFSGYWTDQELKDTLTFISNDLQLHVYCWYFKKPENKRLFEKVSLDRALEIMVSHYLNFHFSSEEFTAESVTKLENEKGIYIQQDVWRKKEVMELSSPIEMTGKGSLYYLRFSNQVLDKGAVKDKSESFVEVTSKLKSWLEKKQTINFK